jgi:hypothetical protein
MRKISQMLETAPAVIAEARYQAGLVVTLYDKNDDIIEKTTHPLSKEIAVSEKNIWIENLLGRRLSRC